ncbi:MAG: hypothetical protein SOT81_05020 [Treponema sp.]|nr:hypothetical protein [Treponema sp.]
MKKLTVFLLVFYFIFSLSGISAETQAQSQMKASESEKKFILGNIKDKIEAVLNTVQNADFQSGLNLSLRGIDYSIENAEILGNNAELLSLAAASMQALSQNADLNSLNEEKIAEISGKIIEIFKNFDDENVKIAAVDCLSKFPGAKWNGTIDVLNDYLEKRYRENHPGNLLIGNVINSLGEFGDSRSFSLVFNIWLNEIWPEYRTATENSLVNLAQNSFENANKAVFFSDNPTILKFFTLMKKSGKNNKNFLENLAEKSLSYAINNAESKQEFLPVFFMIQKETLETLASAKWSRAEETVLKNFSVAKKEFETKIIGDGEFIEIIELTAKFSSPKIAEKLSKLLGEFNLSAEKTEIPSEPVTLALIKSLGELGDKTAFDNLLYVTYLNYSEKVIAQAKDSLAKLKW